MKPAVPEYVGNDFEDAPPGHKYSLYLQCWKEGNWDLESDEKACAMKKSGSLPPDSRKQMEGIAQRLAKLTEHMPNYMTVYGRSIAPFITGMGIEHPLENGFAFLNPYGLPYLPGSSIKGVLLRAACELRGMEETDGWNDEWIQELFGSADRRGALIFQDCVPQLPAASGMSLDIMTPHYGKYYQGEETPHDAGSPTPIPFITVPPDSKFVFHITLTPHLLRSDQLCKGGWQEPIKKAFDHAFDWIGFGAKTSVGYGAMKIDNKAEEEQRSRMEEEENEKRRRIEEEENEKRRRIKEEENEKKRLIEERERLQAMSPVERQIDEVCRQGDPDQSDYQKVINKVREGHWKSPEDIKEAALWIKKRMKKVKQQRNLHKRKYDRDKKALNQILRKLGEDEIN